MNIIIIPHLPKNIPHVQRFLAIPPCWAPLNGSQLQNKINFFPLLPNSGLPAEQKELCILYTVQSPGVNPAKKRSFSTGRQQEPFFAKKTVISYRERCFAFITSNFSSWAKNWRTIHSYYIYKYIFRKTHICIQCMIINRTIRKSQYLILRILIIVRVKRAHFGLNMQMLQKINKHYLLLENGECPILNPFHIREKPE